MLITQNPFPQFFDTDGKPLTDGRVYFGVAGQNPRTSPAAVYTDAAGTQPIAQPVRTLGGYPVRGGSPVNIFTPSTYSVAVYTSTGKLVAYAPDSAAFDSVLSATTAFTRDLLSDVDALAARATLGAASLGANTFTGAQTLPGNADDPLEAVPLQQAQSLAAAAAAAVRNKLASLTVTVNANAMTATLQPETLDFRSATLASGTPVSRSTTVAASLTVPSAATLGTVNGQAARIVWGWLDNGGALEPFVANLAGGLNLDETTLISTTAISGTANSAGVAYSQTARTNVAFRVRGFCDITQATAGTWATAPSLVQGVGGQASATGNRMQYSLTAVQPATGVAVDFNSIPAWAQRVTLVPREVSTNGTSRVQILFQTAAGYLVSGYRGAFVYAANGGGSIGGNVANNFAMDAFAAATDLRNGAVQFSKAPGTNTWIQSGTIGLSNAAAVSTVGGSVPLPGPLTGLRVYTNSADVFDNGDFFLLIEG